MPALVAGHDDLVCEWAYTFWDVSIPQPCRALGIINDEGALSGALALAFRNSHTADLTVLSNGVIRPGIAKGFFRWAFDEIGIHRLEVKTSKKNKPIKKSAPKWGFRFEGTARDYYGPGQDALCFFMTPADCRWIGKEKDGQRARRSTV